MKQKEKELLEAKKQEFIKLYKKSHTDYGYPIVGIVKYEVVFAKTETALSIYKNKRLREERKAKVAVITLAVLSLVVYILFKQGYSENTISNTALAILLTGFAGCLTINFNANHPKLDKQDIIVLFSEKNFRYLDFPSPNL